MKGYKLVGLANNPRAKMSNKIRSIMLRRERQMLKRNLSGANGKGGAK
jgi:hypothetical protein